MNSESRIIRKFGFFLSITLITVIGCSLKRTDPNSDSVGLTIQYNPPQTAPMQLMNTEGVENTFGALTSSTTPTPTPPTGVSGFNCLVVNVVGNGIAPQKNFNLQNPKAVDGLVDGLLAGGYCSYPGVMSAPFSASSSSTQSLTIPSGSKRVIQVIGMQSDAGGYCSTGQFNGTVKTYSYEVGRAVSDILKDTSIAIASSYTAATATNKTVACEGAGGGGASFDPNSLADLTIWYSGGELLDASNTPLAPTANAALPVTNIKIRNKATNAANSNVFNLPYTDNGTNHATFLAAGSEDKGFNIASNGPYSAPASQTFLKKDIPVSGNAADIISAFGASTSYSSFTLVFVGDIPLSGLTTGEVLGIVGLSSVTSAAPFDPSGSNDYVYLSASENAGTKRFKVYFRSSNAATPITETPLNIAAATFDGSGGNGALIHIIQYNGSTQMMKYRILGNGNQDSATASAIAGFKLLNANDHHVHIGRMEITASNAKPFKGSFREMMYFKSAISLSDEDAIVNYLKTKHGVNAP